MGIRLGCGAAIAVLACVHSGCVESAARSLDSPNDQESTAAADTPTQSEHRTGHVLSVPPATKSCPSERCVTEVLRAARDLDAMQNSLHFPQCAEILPHIRNEFATMLRGVEGTVRNLAVECLACDGLDGRACVALRRRCPALPSR